MTLILASGNRPRISCKKCNRRMPPVRMTPNEVDRTNYISGAGLIGTMENTLSQMKSFPVEL